MNAQIQYWRWLAVISLLGTAPGISPAYAQNITPTTNNGTGTVINNNGQQFDITGGTSSGNGANLFHSFQQFNLDAGQTANFVSAPNIHNILGRVTGGDASIINGLITVTGGNSNLYLMNPAGVLFGPNARLDVPASFSVTAATGIGFGNNWFNAVGSNDYQNLVGIPSGYRFDVSQPGAIVNSGNLELSPGQDLTLTGGTVINTGELSTPGGSVTMAAVEGGDVVRISQQGHLLNLEVSNFGGNREEITPLSLPGLLTEGNANSHATGMRVDENGEVILTSGSRNPVSQRNRVSGEGGIAIASGTIDTGSRNPVSLRNRVSEGVGGEVNILGSTVGILDANINADGVNGGGNVNIGGAFQGNNRLSASQQTVINNSIISANALQNGSGGRVIIWSDGTTRFNGNISATGGQNSGDGGFVEVSGKEQLFVNGFIDVGAVNGDTGTILFDPRNITVDELAADLAADFVTDLTDELLGDDNDGDVTISADNLEALEGNVVLQADNDITVNQEITTSESVELNAGRSININADIDTSSGNGNINLLGNDNGANAANRSRGAANINQRENTTLNAGTGNITIRLGSLGEVGGINLENLTTAGRLLVDANGGNIGRVSANSLINANSAIFTTIDEGSIGLAAEPLRLRVENLEATGAGGGAFFESLQGLNVRGITTRAGGDLQLSAEGDVTVRGEISTSTNKGDAGNIEIVSSGGIDSRGSRIAATSKSGRGGDISLRARADIQTGDVNASVVSNGSGGNITLESQNGIIDTTGGNLDAGSILGNGGTIEFRAAGDITTGTVRAASRSSGRGRDQNVEVIGDVSFRDADEIFADGESAAANEPNGTGGAIALTAGGNIDTTGGIVNSSSSTGRGARVTMNAAGVIRTGGINSSGTDGPGGNIALSSSGRGIDTREGVLESRSQTGNGGDITLEAARNVKTQTILSSSTEELSGENSRNGGDITITAGSAIDTSGGLVASSSASGRAGNVIMRASGDVRTEEVVARGSSNGGDITIKSSAGSIDASLGELDASGLGGDGGNILLEAAGDITAEAIATASTTGFEFEVEAGVELEADSLTLVNELTSTQGVSGNGGNITARAGGEIVSLKTIDSSSEFARAGNISLSATGDINIDEIVSSTQGRNGGNIFIESSGGAIAASGVLNSSGADRGNGGNVELSAAGDISITGITSGTRGNDGGSITITAGGSVDAIGGEIQSNSAGGEGGDIAVEATGNIAAAEVSAKGATRGGNITITSTEGGVNTTQGEVNSSATTGIGGEIAINAENLVVTRDIISTGREGGGNISITSEVGDADTTSGELNSSSERGARGDITINAPLGSIAIGRVSQGEVITDEGDLATDFVTDLTDLTETDVTEEGGVVRLEAHNDITIDEAIVSNSISNLEMRAGRNININANINTSRANGDITLQANDAGADPDLRNGGRGNVRMAEGTTLNSGRGDITISLGTFGTDSSIGNITLSNIQTGGTFSVNARGGNILSVSENALVKAGTALFQTLGEGSIGLSGEPLRLDVSILEAKAGSGGAFFYSPNGGLTVGSDEEQLLGIITTGGGDVEIEVEGDLTVAEPISTAVDVGGGGNISLTAAGSIDTSESVLTSTSSRGRGGNITLTGDGDVTAGNINSYSAERGRGGNIIINSEGAIDTTAGSLVSRANNGDGGEISLSADFDLTTGRIESASEEVGNGGQITLESRSGSIDTVEGQISSRGSTGDGGDIAITAPEGDINTGSIFSESSFIGRGGSIELDAGGNVDTKGGEISSSSSDGNGGDISILAKGNIESGEIESNSGLTLESQGSGRGGAGNIVLDAGGYINTVGESLSSVSVGGTGGNIILNSNEDITTGSINTFSTGTGSGGNIVLSSRRGAINTTEGELSSLSSGGNGGNIVISSRQELVTGDLNTLSEGRGGSISLESRQGRIDTREGQLNSNSFSGRGGDVTLNANRDILTGDINSFSTGTGSGGDITITSQNGIIDTTGGQFTSNSVGGNGGNTEISGTRDIITGNITSIAEKSGIAGDITIETAGGAIDTTAGRLSSSSVGGDGGNVSLRATGDINTDVIDSFSKKNDGNGNGGNIALDSDGNIDTSAGVVSSRADGNGNGGNVSLRAGGNISAALVESFSSGTGIGGNIDMNAGGDIDATGDKLLSRSVEGDGGNLTLSAGGNISTAVVESLSQGNGIGGNIDMSAGGDIDTTAGELLSRSKGGDGGDVSLRSGGNITTNAIESLSIDGSGGDISLTAAGDIDATAGELLSRSDVGDGGNVSLSSEGNISTATIESLSQEGLGGDISLSAAGNIDTTADKLTSRSRGGDGGNVSLRSEGSITTNAIESLSIDGRGGNINLNAAGGDIDTTRGQLTSRSEKGDGGNVVLSSEGNISTALIESLSQEALGGNIALSAGGDIDTSADKLTSRSRGGDGGNIGLRSSGDISTGAIESLSEDGRGGDINLNAAGNIDTSRGQTVSRSQTGEGGDATLRAEGDINTGYIESFSESGVRGGNIEIISRSGSVNTTVGDLRGEPQIAPNADVSTEEVATTFETERGNLSSFAPEGTGGNVTIEAKGDITTSHITSFGGEDSGDVRITTDGNINTGVLFSTAIEGIGGEIDIVTNGELEAENRTASRTSPSEGNINIEHIAAYSQNDTGGDIEIRAAGSVTINNAASFGPQQSGSVTITSDSGTITTGTLQTRAPNGTSGNVTLNTFSTQGDIRTANVSSVGSRAAGQVQILAADGSVITEDLESISTGGTAGGIDVGAGGGDVTTGDQTVDAQTGDANINVGASGDISTGNQTATTNDGSASINNVAGGNITAGDQTAVAEGGNASINNVAGGNITVGDQTAVADGGNASINNVAGGNITAGDQTAVAFGGDATINNVAGGNISVGDQTALSEGGNAIITNEAGGNLTTGEQTAVAPDGINQVTNNAGDTINTGELTQGGGDITPFLNNNPVLVVGNNNTLPPAGGVPATPPIVSPSVGAVPPTPPIAPPPVVAVPAIQPIAPPPVGAVPAIQPIAPPPVEAVTPIQPIAPPPVGAVPPTQAVLAIEQPPTQTQAATSNTQFSSSLSQEGRGGYSQLLIPTPITVAANSQTLALLEENRTQEFADYLGLDPEEANSTKNVREILADIEKQTGNRSAVVYVSAHAEQLQLVLYTAEGEPLLKSIPGASRETVLKLVRDLSYKIISPRFRRGSAYLQPAQQLYQWLIAPMAAELEAAGIETLLFSMDEGMRALPIAALHDGEQFLIEKYSLSLIPSISLTDSRYRSLEDTRVLAMGASEFVALNPLPAVPVELETIAQQLWEGRAFLNEEFTLENLSAQRQDYAYPIIHLATHAEFLPGDASNSYVQLWGEEKLSLDRVRELGFNNPAVELLVLSACRTAVGDSNAELGFAGLAVAAGVKSALASLWYVSDEGTLGLMSEFYGYLDETPIKAEALRQAQLAMLRGEVKIEEGQLRSSGGRGAVLVLPPALAQVANSDLSHPYYWSGFTTIGSPW